MKRTQYLGSASIWVPNIEKGPANLPTKIDRLAIVVCGKRQVVAKGLGDLDIDFGGNPLPIFSARLRLN